MKKRIKSGPIDPTRLYSDPELVQFFEWAQIYEADRYWRDRIFLVRLILGTGLRVEEALDLHVPEDCGPQGIMLVRKGKTEGSRRRVKASPELMPYYRSRLLRQEGCRLVGDISTTRSLETWWDDALCAAGVPKIHKRCVHGGRHSWATWELASRRLTLTEVQAQLGHTDPSMTLGFYSHAIIELMYNVDKTPRWWAAALGGLRVMEAAG